MPAVQRRESILVAATQVFAVQGYRRGTVATIAERIGVSEPVVFQNFGTKAALFAAVLDRVTAGATDLLAAATADGGSVRDLLATIVAPSHIATLHAAGGLGTLFAEAAGLVNDPDVGEAARDAIGRIAAALGDLLAHGRTTGEVSPDVDPTAGAWWLMSLVAARTVRRAVAPDPDAVEDRLAAMTLAALTGRAVPAAPVVGPGARPPDIAALP